MWKEAFPTTVKQCPIIFAEEVRNNMNLLIIPTSGPRFQTETYVLRSRTGNETTALNVEIFLM